MTTSSGYSGTPLPRKLGLKAGMRVLLLDPPDGYWDLLGGPPDALEVEVVEPDVEDADFVHLFADDAAALEVHLRLARRTMADDGLAWASWPKKSSGRESEVGRSDVMAAGHAVGLVDVKVCAVDETWSGLKFVVPVEDRAR